MNAWDLLKKIEDYDRRSSIERRLQQQGGWRSFFDMMSHEWDGTSLDQKVNFLMEIIETTGSGLLEIVDLYKKDYGPDRPDIANRAGDAFIVLLDHMFRREAERV